MSWGISLKAMSQEMFKIYRSLNFDWNLHISNCSHVSKWPRSWFNIKMSSYQYSKSHCGDKTILRPSFLHNGISYTGKMSSYIESGHNELTRTHTYVKYRVCQFQRHSNSPVNKQGLSIAWSSHWNLHQKKFTSKLQWQHSSILVSQITHNLTVSSTACSC